jgi:hypothetical protein
MKTIDEIKKTRKPTAEAQARRKEYTQIKKQIKECLSSGEKTIVEISKETGLALETVTYYLMSMRKYHDVEVGEIDDSDEYFYYKLKQ